MSAAPERWIERALAHRTSRADPRVRALFESATIAPAPVEVYRWQSSHGEIVAYEVTVNVTAENLAIATSQPAVMDAVVAVLAAAVSCDPGCSLATVRLRWGRVTRNSHGYRAVPATDLAMDDRDELLRELRRYFIALGQQPPPWLDASVSITFDGDTLVLEGLDRAARPWAKKALTPLARVVLIR